MENKYKKRLWEDLKNIDEEFSFDKMRWLHIHPYPHANSVLRVLIQRACCPQHIGPIMLGREGILEIDRIWRVEHILEAAKECLNFSDYWEYRRFLELVDLSAFELLQDVILIGKDSDDPDVKEASQDFEEYYERLSANMDESFHDDIIKAISDVKVTAFSLAEIGHKYKTLGMSREHMYELLEAIRSETKTEEQEGLIRELMDFMFGWCHSDWKIF